MRISFYISAGLFLISLKLSPIHSFPINNIEKDLILLENDTDNIIEYIEFKNNKKKNKYSFWELLYNDK